MEENQEIKNRKESYIKGLIGAIIGGCIAAIPQILIYAFIKRMIVAILSTLIPFGAFLGYKVCKGKYGKGFPVIITLVSLIIVIVLTTILFPAILVAQSTYELNFKNILGLYSDTRQDIRTAIIQDLIVSILFTIVGIIAVIYLNRNKLKASKGNTEQNAETKKRSKGKYLSIIVALEVIIIIIITVISLNIKTGYTIPDTNIQLKTTDTQILYGTKEEITEKFGEEAAEAYNFIIKDNDADRYDIFGQLVEKEVYSAYDYDTIIQKDRDFYAEYTTEEEMSEIYNIDINNKNVKAYSYTYKGNDENQYRAVVYLYESDSHYLWITVYANIDVELNEIDGIVQDLLK